LLDLSFVKDPLHRGSASAAVVSALDAALVRAPRAGSAKNGGFVRSGYSATLDALRALDRDASTHVEILEEEYRKVTGAPSAKLSVRRNRMHGYFVEVRRAGWDLTSSTLLSEAVRARPVRKTGAAKSKKTEWRRAAAEVTASALVDHSRRGVAKRDLAEEGSSSLSQPEVHRDNLFVLCQSTKTTMRFKTAALTDLDARARFAQERAADLECSIFDELCTQVLGASKDINSTVRMLATVDVHLSLARAATALGFVRPIVDASLDLSIVEGRHPAVEDAHRMSGRAFVPNGVALRANRSVGGESCSAQRGQTSTSKTSDRCPNENDESRLWLVTGPNMGGKSTFLRQTAQIVCLAQTGSFVPARAARIGVVDRLFSRVGAADDIARGRSTFLVEMSETAHILEHATPRSLVIVDEIGRGTAASDGCAIAQAVLEELTKVGCRTLFATHFPELSTVPGVVHRTMEVIEARPSDHSFRSCGPVFTHRLVQGVASSSFGVHVAKVAGLPNRVVARATQLMPSRNRILS
jgi:DNA mismatch repair ATPase MutS